MAPRVQPVLLARLANQELTDLSDLQALLELREPMVYLEHQDLPENPDQQVLDLQGHKVKKETLVNPAKLDHQDLLDHQEEPELVVAEMKALVEYQTNHSSDHADLLDHPVSPDKRDIAVFLDPKDLTERSDHRVKLELKDLKDLLVLEAKQDLEDPKVSSDHQAPKEI